MNFTFAVPRKIVVIFAKKTNGTCKRPLKVSSCINLKTGKEIIITFIARDKRPHKHKYLNSSVLLISSEEEILWDKKHNTHYPAINKTRTKDTITFDDMRRIGV